MFLLCIIALCGAYYDDEDETQIYTYWYMNAKTGFNYKVIKLLRKYQF